MHVDQKYKKNGFLIFNTGLKNTLSSIRKKIIKIFDNSSKMNGLKTIKNDKDIINFSNVNHKLWVAAYDQLRFLPEVLALSNEQTILKEIKKCGIKFPVVNANVLRADMPNIDPSVYSPFKIPHQDYKYYQGSQNAVILWLPLQNADLKIGPINIVKGSHKNGFISDGGDSINDTKFTPVPIKLGKALLFSHWLVHRSGKNRSNNIRFSLQFCFNDLNDKEWAKRKFFFPKKKWVASPKINFTTHFPYKS